MILKTRLLHRRDDWRVGQRRVGRVDGAHLRRDQVAEDLREAAVVDQPAEGHEQALGAAGHRLVDDVEHLRPADLGRQAGEGRGGDRGADQPGDEQQRRRR